jgi:hypothetical protein
MYMLYVFSLPTNHADSYFGSNLMCWGKIVCLWGVPGNWGLHSGKLYKLTLLNTYPWGFDPLEAQVFSVEAQGYTVIRYPNYRLLREADKLFEWPFGKPPPAYGG